MTKFVLRNSYFKVTNKVSWQISETAVESRFVPPYDCILQLLIHKLIPKHVNRHSRLTYEANLFNKNFNNFNKFLTISKCSPELNFESDFTVDSCMNNNFYVVDFYSLELFTRLNIFKALKSNSHLPKEFTLFSSMKVF